MARRLFSLLPDGSRLKKLLDRWMGCNTRNTEGFMAYGGRSSDKYINTHSGFLKYLCPGDEVMADRGFVIQDLLRERKVKLVVPAFTNRGLPLHEEDITNTRRIANVREHAERVIRHLKN
ncbi:hypothetical protein ACEWY4_001996 [Coilia grayii]|uniref:DDE Tnp4 domain-containing protein n=1 Tax=Coilia grayii TaxID=363190 RepID=A0ABD1KVR9_9TELE